jgi:hypothetical protein
MLSLDRLVAAVAEIGDGIAVGGGPGLRRLLLN